MTQYQRGYRFEREVMFKLINDGYFVIRAAGSHGPFDLVAIRGFDVKGIQCKINGKITNEEISKMKYYGEKYGILPMIAWKDKEGIHLKVID